MRFFIKLILLSLLFNSCYEDSDFTIVETEEEISSTRIDAGLSGKLNSENTNSEELSLEVDNQVYDIKDNFFIDLKDVKKRGQMMYLKSGNDLVAFGNPLLIENDINYFEFINLGPPRTEEIDVRSSNNIVIGEVNVELGSSGLLKDGEIISNNERLKILEIEDVNTLKSFASYGFDKEKEPLFIEPVMGFHLGLDDSAITFDPRLSYVSYNNSDQLALFMIDGFDNLVLVAEGSELNRYPISSQGLYILGTYRDAVYIEGTIHKDGYGISYMPLKIENTNNFYSTSKGRWAQYNTINTEIDLQVLSPCYDFIQSQKLLLSQDDKLDVSVDLKANEGLIYNLKTRVINCDGSIDEIQAVNIDNGSNSYIYVFEEGTVDKWIPVCQKEFSISGVSVGSFAKGPLFTWSVDFNDDVSFVSNCPELEEGFAYFVINGEENVYSAFEINADLEHTVLRSEANKIRIRFDGSMERTYAENEVRIFISDPDFGNNGYAISCENSPVGCGINDFQVTHFEDAGSGWFRASFSGVLWAQTIDPPVAGNYQLEGIILSKVQ